MKPDNMPESTPGPVGSGQFTLWTMLIVVLACALCFAAVKNFRFLALTPEGLAAGILMSIVVGVVGTIFGSVPAARVVIFILSGITFGGILFNKVSAQRFTLWTFSCLAAGLLIGVLVAWRRSGSSEAEVH